MSSYACRCGSKFDLLSQLVSHAAGCTAELVESAPSASTNSAMVEIAAELTDAIGHICGGTYQDAIDHINEALRRLRQ